MIREADFLLMEELLSEEEKIIRDTTRRFVEREVLPIVAKHYEKGTFPYELIPKVAEVGLFGITTPPEYGGAGASYFSYGLACQELEWCDSGLRSLVSVQNSLCMYPIHAYGSEGQKQKYLPKMATGEIIGCFGLTEPDAGSDPASMRTTAKKVKDGWVLNGNKTWITNAPIAHMAIVWAKTEEGVRGFIVEMGGTEGFETHEIKEKMSLRFSPTGEIVLEDCFVPEENLLPGSSVGMKAPFSCLTRARYGIAWGAVGMAAFCYEKALSYAQERIQFGRPLASFQLIQQDLADMLTEITKCQLLVYRVGRLFDEGRASHAMVSMAKRASTMMAYRVVRKAREILGGNGISLEYHVIRHLCNSETTTTYEGTNKIHALILGRHITGISAFK